MSLRRKYKPRNKPLKFSLKDKKSIKKLVNKNKEFKGEIHLKTTSENVEIKNNDYNPESSKSEISKGRNKQTKGIEENDISKCFEKVKEYDHANSDDDSESSQSSLFKVDKRLKILGKPKVHDYEPDEALDQVSLKSEKDLLENIIKEKQVKKRPEIKKEDISNSAIEESPLSKEIANLKRIQINEDLKEINDRLKDPDSEDEDNNEVRSGSRSPVIENSRPEESFSDLKKSKISLDSFDSAEIPNEPSRPV